MALQTFSAVIFAEVISDLYCWLPLFAPTCCPLLILVIVISYYYDFYYYY